MKSNAPIVLDCTLRDGGYYNNWDFPRDLVSAYFKSLDASGVDVIEIGLRNFSMPGFFGPYAYSTDDFISSLNLKPKAKLSVMIESKSLLNHSKNYRETIGKLFAPASESPVSIVRIATHLENAVSCKEFCNELASLGYTVGLNLMQIAGADFSNLKNIIIELSTWGTIDVLYFADSFGNLSPEMTSEIVTFLKKHWDRDLGIHAHNNKDLALTNTIVAQKLGVKWLDATVLGMGRGAGNTKTELLLLELNSVTGSSYLAENLFPLVFDKFEPMQKHYGWGPNLLYFLSANHSIHPSYVQFMSSEKALNSNKIMDVLYQIKNRTDRSSFKQQNLDEALFDCYSTDNSSGEFNASGYLLGRTVLILGTGPGRIEHKDAILHFIETKKPYVISLNASNLDHFGNVIDAYASCHFSRMLLDADSYQKIDKPLIVPKSLVPTNLLSSLNDKDILDYGITLKKGSFRWEPNHCQLEAPLALGYAVSFCNIANANKIYLCGFDGYGPNFDKQKEMEHLLESYNKIPSKLPLVSLTPTTYASLESNSIYNPFL